MVKTGINLLLALLLSLPLAVAPDPVQGQALDPVTQIDFITPPIPIPGIGAGYSGPVGGIQFCYWVVAQFTGGGRTNPSSPACVDTSGLSPQNRVTLTWTGVQPGAQYTLLRTTSASLGNSCNNCLLTTTTGLRFVDDGTVAPGSFNLTGVISPSIGSLYIDNLAFASPLFRFSPRISPQSLGSGNPDSTNFLRGDGVWAPGGGGGGGAPTTAEYWLGVADGTLPNGIVVNDLATLETAIGGYDFQDAGNLTTSCANNSIIFAGGGAFTCRADATITDLLGLPVLGVTNGLIRAFGTNQQTSLSPSSVVLDNTQNGTGSGVLEFYKRRLSNPANVGDKIGRIDFRFYDSIDGLQTGVSFESEVTNNSLGTEAAKLDIRTLIAGSLTTVVTLENGDIIIPGSFISTGPSRFDLAPNATPGTPGTNASRFAIIAKDGPLKQYDDTGALVATYLRDDQLSGNTAEVASVSGAKTVSKQLEFDPDGNIQASSADIGGGGGSSPSWIGYRTIIGNESEPTLVECEAGVASTTSEEEVPDFWQIPVADVNSGCYFHLGDLPSDFDGAIRSSLAWAATNSGGCANSAECDITLAFELRCGAVGGFWIGGSTLVDTQSVVLPFGTVGTAQAIRANIAQATFDTAGCSAGNFAYVAWRPTAMGTNVTNFRMSIGKVDIGVTRP